MKPEGLVALPGASPLLSQRETQPARRPGHGPSVLVRAENSAISQIAPRGHSSPSATQIW